MNSLLRIMFHNVPLPSLCYLVRMSRFFMLMFALVLQGCYSFTATSLPSHIRTVTIPDIQNQTTDPVLGNRLHQAVVELFQKNAPGIRVVNSDGDADFQLTLVNYTNAPENFSRDAAVETYKVTLVVNATFRDQVKNTVIYDGRNLRADGVYDVTKNETEDRHGQQRAIEKLQELIVNNALARW